MASQVRDLHLPEPGMDDGPRRHEQDGGLTFAEHLEEELDPVALEVAVLIRVSGPHRSPPRPANGIRSLLQPGCNRAATAAPTMTPSRGPKGRKGWCTWRSRRRSWQGRGSCTTSRAPCWRRVRAGCCVPAGSVRTPTGECATLSSPTTSTPARYEAWTWAGCRS